MYSEVDDGRLTGAPQSSIPTETPSFTSRDEESDGNEAPEAKDAGAWEKINIGHLSVAAPEEGEEEWSDEFDDWNEHVWSVAEFLPRSIPCWSPLVPEDFTEDMETDFVMSAENIRRILADEVFEVIELDEEQESTQSYMAFSEYESRFQSESSIASIREASIYKKLQSKEHKAQF